MNATARDATPELTDSPYAWWRLAVSVMLSTVGGVGMWSVVVVLPSMQADFGVDRAAASLPYTLTMFGFAGGGVLLGQLADRFGVTLPVILSTIALGAGYIAVGYSTSLWQVAIAHGLLIGVGTSATFAPLMADISHWFVRRRGIAVAIAGWGNFGAATLGPRVLHIFPACYGGPTTYIGIGVFCVVTMLPMALLLRRRMATGHSAASGAAAAAKQAALPFSPMTLQVLLCIAGVACCVAMSMPQVHIVAYCGDLGYGVARGADMLSLMLGFGIISRVASGFVADRIGGVGTLLIGSVAQGVALLLYLMFDGLMSLYIISAMFGLFQGGIVPSYAIIVREYFPPHQASTRVGLVIMMTILGMALGGWLSGAIFDLTGSYQLAFLNGLGWNLINVSIMAWLLIRSRQKPTLAQLA
jgi:MFS family permease